MGVGTVGHSADDDDLQQRHVPADLSNIGSSSSSNYRGSASSQKYTGNAYEDDDDLQQRHVPADLSNIGSSAYRSSASHTNEEELQRNSGTTYVPVYQRGGTGQNSYSSRQESTSETRSGTRVPAAIPLYSSTSLNSRGSSSNSDSEFQDTRTSRPVHPGQYVQVQARPGQTVVLNVPVRAGEQYTSSGRSDYSESTNKVQPSTYSVSYRPTTTYAADKAASSSNLERTRVGYTPTNTRVVYQPADSNRVVYQPAYQPADQTRQQPEKLVNPDIVSYGSYGQDSASSSTQERYGADEELGQVRVAPVQITGSTDTRYAAGNRGHVSNTRIVPASVVSSSSSRTNEEREERTRTQSRPTYVYPARTTSNNYGSNSHDEYGTSGSQLNSLSQTQNQRSGSSGYASQARIPTHSASGSTREGSGVLSASNDDLTSYMTESQRLAQQQSRQISTGSRGTFGATNAESANRITHQNAANNQASSNQFFNSRINDFDLADVGTSANGNGAYQQSWQKQSKWASGSEYGTDGQPKTYTHLTTAESEKHKINGHEEGYKAATTTLENDGKVSTYSIRTP